MYNTAVYWNKELKKEEAISAEEKNWKTWNLKNNKLKKPKKEQAKQIKNLKTLQLYNKEILKNRGSKKRCWSVLKGIVKVSIELK